MTRQGPRNQTHRINSQSLWERDKQKGSHDLILFLSLINTRGMIIRIEMNSTMIIESAEMTGNAPAVFSYISSIKTVKVSDAEFVSSTTAPNSLNESDIM